MSIFFLTKLIHHLVLLSEFLQNVPNELLFFMPNQASFDSVSDQLLENTGPLLYCCMLTIRPLRAHSSMCPSSGMQ